MLRVCGPCVAMAVGLAGCAAPSLGRQGTANQMLGPALETCAPVRLRAVRTQLEGYWDWLELRERLASLGERVTPEDSLRAVASGAGHERLRGPDAWGCVCAREDDWIAVRLDPGSPEPRQWDGMALFRGDVYLGELVVYEVWRGHALGRSILLPNAALAHGDRAAHRSERMQRFDGR
jgi:hypothetical protein